WAGELHTLFLSCCACPAGFQPGFSKGFQPCPRSPAEAGRGSLRPKGTWGFRHHQLKLVADKVSAEARQKGRAQPKRWFRKCRSDGSEGWRDSARRRSTAVGICALAERQSAPQGRGPPGPCPCGAEQVHPVAPTHPVRGGDSHYHPAESAADPVAGPPVD